MTVRASLEGGQNWRDEYTVLLDEILLDEMPSVGNSGLLMSDSETAGVLYEGSQSQLTFQRVKISDILK